LEKIAIQAGPQIYLNRSVMKISTLYRKAWFYPLSVLLVMLCAYALQVFNLGYYWDDWQSVYLASLEDPSAWWGYFVHNRPFSVWTFLLIEPVLGNVPLRWQLFTLVVRWASVLCFYGMLVGIWPQRVRASRWAGLFLAVYPGFTQQWVSHTYSQHFITYLLFTLSMWLMVLSIRRRVRFALLMPLAVVTSLLSMATMEYYVTLELLRPFVLWYLLRTDGENLRTTLKRVVTHWIPYILALVLFVIYRFSIYPSISPSPGANSPTLLSQLASAPMDTIFRLVEIILQDFIHINIFTWAGIIAPETIELQARMVWFSWGVGLAVAFLYTLMSGSFSDWEDSNPKEAGHGFLIGIAAVLLGGLPIWLTDRQIIVGMWSDRFSLAPMLGGVLLLVWLVVWLSRTKQQKGVILMLLLGFSIASHIRTGNKYRLNWELQRDYYWQLSWRVPDLEPGTIILGTKLPFGLVADYSVGFALNTIYAQPHEPENIPFWFLSAPRYLGKNIPAFEPDLPIYDDIRNVHFEGTTSQSLGVAYNPARGCLRILDPVYLYAPVLSDGAPGDFEQDLYAISNPGQISIPSGVPASPPRDIFGSEPEHGWCYYYQKMDLYRQLEDWDAVIAVGSEAADAGLSPSNGVEFLPLIEANAWQGEWGAAQQYTLAAAEKTTGLEPFICENWRRFQEDYPTVPARDEAISAVENQFHCEQMLELE
jgi:hypothetical protein